MGVFLTYGDKFKHFLQLDIKNSPFTVETSTVASKGNCSFDISAWQYQYGNVGLPNNVCIGITTCYSQWHDEYYLEKKGLNLRSAGLIPTYNISGGATTVLSVDNYTGASVEMTSVRSYLGLAVVSADCVKDG